MTHTTPPKLDTILSFDIYLFDFDGLLVDTEQFHYRAYQLLLAQRGLVLPFGFERFCLLAHCSSTAVRDEIHRLFPQLREFDWQILYAEKKKAYQHLLVTEEVKLMPGVAQFLTLLKQLSKRCAVVTHSPRVQIDEIKKNNAIFDFIELWITREDYVQPKPNPDSYLTALKQMGCPPAARAIGFEDSPRGLQALKSTAGIQPVWIANFNYPNYSELKAGSVWHYPSFLALMQHFK